MKKLINRLIAWRLISQANHLRRESAIAYATAAMYYDTASAMADSARTLETKYRILLMGV